MARKKTKQGGHVKNRVKDALNGSNGSPKCSVTKMPEPATLADERIPATEADYLAAQLHQARSQLVQFKQTILAKDEAILQKDLQLIQKDKAILALEAKMVDEQNATLRTQHSLQFDKTIHKDDETGEVYWLKAEEAPKQS